MRYFCALFIFLAFLVGFSASTSAASRCTPSDWAGTWDTRYKTMTLNVTGYKVSGTYNVQNHRLWGSLNRDNPCVFDGYWKHASSSSRGRVRFVMTRPGHFEGSWASGNAEPKSAVNWTGDKTAASEPSRPDTSSSGGGSGRFRSRWDKIGGLGGPWTTGWVPNHTFQGCGHQAPGCSCGGQNYCGTYRDGATTYWWAKGCGGPRWTIRCTSVPQ